MKALSSIVVLSILLSSCQDKQGQVEVDWKLAGLLPAMNELPHLGLAGPITGVLVGKVLVAGGANFPDKMPWDGGAKFYQTDAYLYDITDDSLVYHSTISFPDTLAYAANVTGENAIYTIGGKNENGISKLVTKYVLNDQLQIKSERLPSLPMALSNGSAVQVGDFLYFIGGENSELVSDKIYRLALEGGQSWEEVLTLPYEVTHAVVVTDGKSKIFIAGGRKRNLNAKSDIYNQVLEVDLASNQIKEIAKLPQALAAGTGVFAQNRLILIGGDDASTFHRVEQLIGEINTSQDESLKNELIQAKNQIQRQHPGFSKEVMALNLENGAWEKLNPLIGESPVTTTAILHDGKIIIPSGESRAGVRTPQILIGTITTN